MYWLCNVVVQSRKNGQYIKYYIDVGPLWFSSSVNISRKKRKYFEYNINVGPLGLCLVMC